MDLVGGGGAKRFRPFSLKKSQRVTRVERGGQKFLVHLRGWPEKFRPTHYC